MSDWLPVTISTVSLVFSCVSTVVAGLTAFFTFVRRPKVRMTQPTFLALAFDGPEALPKVFTRTLMYCTAQPGKVVEALFARIRQGEMRTLYSFWSYSAEGRLAAGGGLFVGLQGIVTDHHFVVGKGGDRPIFAAGPLAVAFCARVVGQKAEQCLYQIELELTDLHARELNIGRAGVSFERSPDSDHFHAAIMPIPELRQTRSTATAPGIASVSVVGPVH